MVRTHFLVHSGLDGLDVALDGGELLGVGPLTLGECETGRKRSGRT